MGKYPTSYNMKNDFRGKVNTIRRCCYTRYSRDDIYFKDIEKLVGEHSAIVIDVRSPQEYEESHINGAINIPLWSISKNIFNVAENKNQYIVLYCSSGIRSRRAQKILKGMGYKNVFNVSEAFF